jgi:hypothetical protein
MAHSPTFVHAQPTAMRAASAIIVRHLLSAHDRVRAPTIGRSRAGAKTNVITITYERRADGIKVLLWSLRSCFSPVINREDGIRMLQVRRAGEASGQAPRTSEKAVSPRDLTDRERAFSLRRRGGSLTSHRPHASSRGYLAVRPLRVRLITKNQYAIQNETRIVRV